MAKIESRFIQAKTRANFETRLKAGDIDDTQIVFIEDTDLIWAKGKYYSSIPKNGASGLVLSWKADGEAKWDTLEPCTANEINSLFE